MKLRYYNGITTIQWIVILWQKHGTTRNHSTTMKTRCNNEREQTELNARRLHHSPRTQYNYNALHKSNGKLIFIIQ